MTNKNKIEDSIREGYTFPITSYFSQGFDYFKERVAEFMGFGLVLLITTFVLDYALKPAPLWLGFVISDFIMTVLGLGVALYTYRLHMDESQEFTHFFDGFKNLIPLGSLYLLQGLFFGLLAWVISRYVPLEELMEMAGQGYSTENVEEMAALLEDSIGIVFFTFLVLIYVSITLRWSYMLVLFHQFNPWEAITKSFRLVNKKFFSHFAIMILFGFLYLCGAILFYVGLVIAVPLIGIINFISFADVTGLHKSNPDQKEYSESNTIA